MSEPSSYALYLTAEASDADPLYADAVDFYDSGVWVTHAAGRDFFPYERVRRIREDPTPEDSPDADRETTGERRDAASGATETGNGPTLDVE